MHKILLWIVGAVAITLVACTTSAPTATAPISTAPFKSELKAEKDGAKCSFKFEADGAGRANEHEKNYDFCAALFDAKMPADVEINASLEVTVTGTVDITGAPMPVATVPIGLEIDHGPITYSVSAFEGGNVISFKKMTEYGDVYAKDLYVNDQIYRFCGIWLLGEKYDTLRISYNCEEISKGNVVATFREWKLEELFPLPK